jgi:hypothetical protein
VLEWDVVVLIDFVGVDESLDGFGESFAGFVVDLGFRGEASGWVAAGLWFKDAIQSDVFAFHEGVVPRIPGDLDPLGVGVREFLMALLFFAECLDLRLFSGHGGGDCIVLA